MKIIETCSASCNFRGIDKIKLKLLKIKKFCNSFCKTAISNFLSRRAFLLCSCHLSDMYVKIGKRNLTIYPLNRGHLSQHFLQTVNRHVVLCKVCLSCGYHGVPANIRNECYVVIRKYEVMLQISHARTQRQWWCDDGSLPGPPSTLTLLPPMAALPNIEAGYNFRKLFGTSI